jgi:hypothetical protein
MPLRRSHNGGLRIKLSAIVKPAANLLDPICGNIKSNLRKSVFD